MSNFCIFSLCIFSIWFRIWVCCSSVHENPYMSSFSSFSLCLSFPHPVRLDLEFYLNLLYAWVWCLPWCHRIDQTLPWGWNVWFLSQMENLLLLSIFFQGVVFVHTLILGYSAVQSMKKFFWYCFPQLTVTSIFFKELTVTSIFLKEVIHLICMVSIRNFSSVSFHTLKVSSMKPEGLVILVDESLVVVDNLFVGIGDSLGVVSCVFTQVDDFLPLVWAWIKPFIINCFVPGEVPGDRRKSRIGSWLAVSALTHQSFRSLLLLLGYKIQIHLLNKYCMEIKNRTIY